MVVTGSLAVLARNPEQEGVMGTQEKGKNVPGAGSQHNDWGHNKAGNAQSGQEESRQGSIPGEEAGELDSGLGGIGSLSTGHAGSLQSERESEPGTMRPG
jgi:hypothetical protein